MTLEYLFVNKDFYQEIKRSAFENIQKRITCINNSECWILKLSLKGENKKTAKILSETNNEILSKFNPVLLKNESSAYFNKKLYPYINEFERRLRRLLYLANVTKNNPKANENLLNLELKSFGELFNILFIDSHFIKSVKSFMNQKSNSFTKNEILKEINSVEELTVWKSLLGDHPISELENDFFAIKNYRNSVMHAHNIDYKTYSAALKLFKKTNKQLDLEIKKLIGDTEKPMTISINLDTNRFIEAMNQYVKYEQMLSNLSNSLRAYEHIASPKLWDNLSNMQISPAMIDAIQQDINISNRTAIPPEALLIIQQEMDLLK